MASPSNHVRTIQWHILPLTLFSFSARSKAPTSAGSMTVASILSDNSNQEQINRGDTKTNTKYLVSRLRINQTLAHTMMLIFWEELSQ